MKSLLAWIRGYQVENPGLKLLALVVATLLFAISRQPLSDVRLAGVQLEYRGLAQGLEISGGEVNQSVSVRLRGPRDVLRNIVPNQIAVVADLSGKEPGDRVVQLRANEVIRPENVEVLQVDPATIRLQIELTIRRKVRVEPKLIGKVPEGFEIYDVKVDPAMVEIQGPQSQVNEVRSVSTESVQLLDRASSFDTSVDVDHPNHALRVVTPGPIKLAVEIGERRVLRRIDDLPVRWLDQPAGGRLLTPKVTLELLGPRSLVESITPDQIRVELRTANLPAKDQTKVPEVFLPEAARGRIQVREIKPGELRFKQL